MLFEPLPPFAYPPTRFTNHSRWSLQKPLLFARHFCDGTRLPVVPTYRISWTAETVENFLPLLSVSETDITKALSQYSSVMICVCTITLPILAMVWGLRTCELVVTNKNCLLTCVSDAEKGGRKFSTVSAVQEIISRLIWSFPLTLRSTIHQIAFFSHHICPVSTLGPQESVSGGNQLMRKANIPQHTGENFG